MYLVDQLLDLNCKKLIIIYHNFYIFRNKSLKLKKNLVS